MVGKAHEATIATYNVVNTVHKMPHLRSSVYLAMSPPNYMPSQFLPAVQVDQVGKFPKVCRPNVASRPGT